MGTEGRGKGVFVNQENRNLSFFDLVMLLLLDGEISLNETEEDGDEEN